MPSIDTQKVVEEYLKAKQFDQLRNPPPAAPDICPQVAAAARAANPNSLDAYSRAYNACEAAR